MSMTTQGAIAMVSGELPINVVDATRQGTETTMGPMEDSLLPQSCMGSMHAYATTSGATTDGAMTNGAITHSTTTNSTSWEYGGAWPGHGTKAQDAAFQLSHGGERRQGSSLALKGSGVPPEGCHT